MEDARIKEIFAGFAGKRILVVGDVFLDRYIYGKVERLNPEAPVPILNAVHEEVATGGAGNVAKNAAMLGVNTTLISVVGSGMRVNQLKEAATSEGYELCAVDDGSRSMIEKIRYLVGSQQMLRVDYEEVRDIDKEIEANLIRLIEERGVKVDGILVSDYAKGILTQPVAEAIMKIRREKQIPVLADVKPSHINWFTGVDYISPNRKEAHECLGINRYEGGGRDPKELAQMLHETFQVSVFLTLSEQGIYLLTDRVGGEHWPAEYVESDEVLDPSGCGDTAATIILLAKLAEATDSEAAQLANAAGATVARKIGSAGLTLDELIHTITDHHAK